MRGSIGDQRRLREPRLAPREDRVDAREPVADGVLRDALQVQVERRVDVDRAGRPWSAPGSSWRQVVDEVRRLGLERARDDLHRLVRRALGVVLR